MMVLREKPPVGIERSEVRSNSCLIAHKTADPFKLTTVHGLGLNNVFGVNLKDAGTVQLPFPLSARQLRSFGAVCFPVCAHAGHQIKRGENAAPISAGKVSKLPNSRTRHLFPPT